MAATRGRLLYRFLARCDAAPCERWNRTARSSGFSRCRVGHAARHSKPPEGGTTNSDGRAWKPILREAMLPHVVVFADFTLLDFVGDVLPRHRDHLWPVVRGGAAGKPQ